MTRDAATVVLVLLLSRLDPVQCSQSGIGRSTESITSMSTGPRADSSFSPSCSGSAEKSSAHHAKTGAAPRHLQRPQRPVNGEVLKVGLGDQRCGDRSFGRGACVTLNAWNK
jgi:hypothetical protein